MKDSDENFVASLRLRVENTCVSLGISREVARMVAAEVVVGTQREYGGCEPYIPKPRQEAEERKRRALAEARTTGRVAPAAKNHGLSRATIYRLLKPGN